MTHMESPMAGGASDLSPSLHSSESPTVVPEAPALRATRHPLKRKLQAGEEKLECPKLSGQTRWRDGPAADEDLGSRQSLGVEAKAKTKRVDKQEVTTADGGCRVCKVCGTSFTKKFFFDRHMKTHAGLFTDV